MAEVQLTGVYKLVARATFGGETWTNSIHVHRIAVTGPLNGSEGIVEGFHKFARACLDPTATLQDITGYAVYYQIPHAPAVEHPPIFTNTYNQAGQFNTLVGGAVTSNWLSKDAVCYCKVTTTGGRSGKMFIRGMLAEEDVTSALAGVWGFQSGSTHFTVSGFAAMVAGELGDWFVGGVHAADDRWCVLHLASLHDPADTRIPFVTDAFNLVAERPSWNDARR